MEEEEKEKEEDKEYVGERKIHSDKEQSKQKTDWSSCGLVNAWGDTCDGQIYVVKNYIQ